MDIERGVVGEDSNHLALPLATLALFAAFACWTLLAAVGVQLKQVWQFSETTFAAVLVLPLLAGGIFAPVMGALAERYGGRRIVMAGLIGLATVLAALLTAKSAPALMLAGLGFGLAGGIFSAGLQYVTDHPTGSANALRIAVYLAGMSGAGFSYLIVPVVGSAYDWRVAPVAYLCLILFALLVMATMTLAETPNASLRFGVRAKAPAIESRFPWSLCGFYAVLFGGLVALALWLPDYLRGHYHLGVSDATSLALWFLVPAMLSQTLGAALNRPDVPHRIQRPALWLLLGSLFFLSYPSTSMSIQGIQGTLHLSLALSLPVFLGLVVVAGVGLGVLSGSLMCEAVERYPRSAARLGGAMLMCGCGMGFVLTLLFGLGNDLFGVRSAAFMMLFAMVAIWAVLRAWAQRAEERRRFRASLSPKG